jgi:hypothetical protein
MGRISMRGFVVAAFVVGAGIVAIRLQFIVPHDISATPITRVVLASAASSDNAGGAQGPSSAGQACLDRIHRDGGWLDLCWSADDYGRQADGSMDYYMLRMYGSHQGLRWLDLRSQVLGNPGYGLFDAWPVGTYEGDCRQAPVTMLVPLAAVRLDDICGRSEARSDPVNRWSQLTWTCESCLVPDRQTRAVSLYAVVSVPAGTAPSWDLFADGGS